MKHKKDILKEIEDLQSTLKSSHLMPLPGIQFSAFRSREGKICPAYMLPSRNNSGIPFVMPDWVKHKGLIPGEGFQNFGHDTMHLVQNNLNENAPRIKRCWSELHDSGSNGARWRDGVLGRGGVLEGETVVLCAPGPSLADDLEAIKGARASGKVKVVAINRAVRALEADYLVYIERHCPAEWRDEHVRKLQKDAKLIVGFQSDYHLTEDWPNQDNIYWGYFNFGRFEDDERVKHLAMMDAMASTTLGTALRVVYELGAKNILLAGVDFSCRADIIPIKEPIDPPRAESVYSMLHAMSVEVAKGNGKKDRVKELAENVIELDSNREKYGWSYVWRPINFYYDVKFDDSPYKGDPRFNNWKPVRSSGGHPVLTTLEFMSYADQLRTVIGIIESGSDCRVINVSPYSALSWRYAAIDEALPEEVHGNTSRLAHCSA